jgi:hypothetical protein
VQSELAVHTAWQALSLETQTAPFALRPAPDWQQSPSTEQAPPGAMQAPPDPLLDAPLELELEAEPPELPPDALPPSSPELPPLELAAPAPREHWTVKLPVEFSALFEIVFDSDPDRLLPFTTRFADEIDCVHPPAVHDWFETVAVLPETVNGMSQGGHAGSAGALVFVTRMPPPLAFAIDSVKACVPSTGACPAGIL